MSTIEGERLAMARDLHDTVVQDLIVAVVKLRNALKCQDMADRSRSTLQGYQAAEEALLKTRALLRKLRGLSHPKVLRETSSCPDQIARVLQSVSRDSALQTRLYCAAPIAMSKDVAHEVSQIVREAATNVRRHAKATMLTCNIEEHQGTLRIDVIDDGIGFQMKRKRVGLGMLGMHERAHLIGATLAIQSEPERGSVVRLIIPPCRFEVVNGQIA